MKSLSPNTLLQNRYLIVQLIGKGGMGEVYLAVDQRLGSAVALKRMLYSGEELLGQAFEREAKMLARLRHSALTKVSDHFTENEIQYLVMEHITGDDLAKKLEDGNEPLPLKWVLFWADQLLDALTYLHSHEPPIIHRDVKPQNLKVNTENNIILLDFGLAKTSGGETRLSTTGDVMGYTPHYASMEQIRGTGTTARSDIYSLCATMYQLLSNVVPADALSRAEEVLNAQPDPVKPLNEVNKDVPLAISDIVKRGMSLSAEQRFASAKEMQVVLRDAFTKIQQDETNSPQPIVQNDVKNEQFSAPDFGEPVGEKTEVMSNINFDLAPLEKTELLPVIANEPVSFAPPTPFVQKEEVAEISEDFDGKTAISPIDYSFDDKTQNFQSQGIEPEVSNAELNPNLTIPLVNLGENIAPPPPPVGETLHNQQFESQNNFQNSEKVDVPVLAPPPKKKAAGGGKGLIIAGTLGVLAILGLGAIGGGLFFFKPDIFGGAVATPTPAATPKPTVVPTVEPTSSPTVAPTVQPTTTLSPVASPTNVSTPTPVATKQDPPTDDSVQKNPTPIVKPANTPPQPTPKVVVKPQTVKTPAVAKTTPHPSGKPTPDRTGVY